MIPTFKIHRRWIRQHQAIVEKVRNGLKDEGAKEGFQLLSWQAMHSHETGWMNNVILLLASLFFLVGGSTAFGLDLLVFK